MTAKYYFLIIKVVTIFSDYSGVICSYMMRYNIVIVQEIILFTFFAFFLLLVIYFIYTHTCTHIYIHIYIHTYTYIQAYIYIRIY